MPPALLERHGIDPEEVEPVNEAFAAGDVAGALLERRRMRSPIGSSWPGPPMTGSEWLNGTYAPAGLNHALVSFTDPFTLQAWAGIELEGLPDLGEQVRLVGEQVLPELTGV